MALYTVRVRETRVYLVECMVEAQSTDEALELAEQGDYVAERTMEMLERSYIIPLPKTLALAQPAGVESTPG